MIAGSMEIYQFTTLREVWLSPHEFSQNSKLLHGTAWKSFIPNFSYVKKHGPYRQKLIYSLQKRLSASWFSQNSHLLDNCLKKKKKNSYTDVHENPTNGVDVDTESHRNEEAWHRYEKFFCFLVCKEHIMYVWTTMNVPRELKCFIPIVAYQIIANLFILQY